MSTQTGPSRECIQAAIDQYAKAYNAMEKVQTADPSGLIPRNDQKTGAIGEYYAMQYCRKKYDDPEGKTISFGGHSQASWDISIKESGKKPFKIQVKTVSAFAEGRKTTPIKIFEVDMSPVVAKRKLPIKLLEPWHQLFIINLDKCFLPIDLWIFEPETFKGRATNKGFNLTLPQVDAQGKFVNGSSYFAGVSPINDEYWDEVLDEARDGKGLYGCLVENEVIEEKGG